MPSLSSLRFPHYVLLVLVTAVPLCLGCGGGGDESGAKKKDTGTEVASSGVGAPPSNDRDAKLRTDSTGRKWYGDIPLDVWYANPLAVAGNSNPVGSDPNAAVGNPLDGGSDPTPMADPMPMAGGGGGDDWGKLIPADVVAAEVKDAQNRMTQALNSVASYNQEHLSLPPYIHTLAVMGHIATMHPGDIRWKENAGLIRDLAAKIVNQGTPMQGPRGKKAMEEHFFPLTDVFAGSPPAGLEPATEVLFSDLAEMGELMKRIDIGFNKRVVIEINSEEALTSKKDLARHEGAILAAIGKVIVQEGYGYAEDDVFKGHAKGMVDGGVAMVEAAEAGDFAKYDQAKTMVTKACTDCHRTYR